MHVARQSHPQPSSITMKLAASIESPTDCAHHYRNIRILRLHATSSTNVHAQRHHARDHGCDRSHSITVAPRESSRRSQHRRPCAAQMKSTNERPREASMSSSAMRTASHAFQYYRDHPSFSCSPSVALLFLRRTSCLLVDLTCRSFEFDVTSKSRVQ